MIVAQVKRAAKPGTKIPKPNTDRPYKVKDWGTRRGEEALVYLIPNLRNPERPYEKGITESEWEKAYGQIMRTGTFTRRWFGSKMQACANEGGCNFTTIGGVFQLLGIAEYQRGEYVRKDSILVR